MTTEDFREIQKSIPLQPGVYRFIDRYGKVIYVGKAKKLRNRLSSYFGIKKHQAFKTRTMVKNAEKLEYTVVDSEHDALLLECTLIKKLQPKFNVMLKDGKSYSYICIKKERFPRVFFTRKVIRDGSTYFGPYSSKYRAAIVLDVIKQLFPLRTCTLNLSEELISAGKYKPCLEYHIKNCEAPCVDLESEEAYNEKIKQIKNVLRGNLKSVRDYILDRMKEAAENLEFEKAQELKEKLDTFDYYQSKSTVVSTAVRDVDVFSLLKDENIVYVNYLKVINGVLMTTDTVEFNLNVDEDEEELLAYAIQLLREKFNSTSSEIILSSNNKYLDKEIKQTIPKIGDKYKLLELANKNIKYYLIQKKKEEISKIKKVSRSERILKTLQKDLEMESVPLHIECFDNSNIQGTNPVASCVVFKNAKPSKKDYRKFKIKTVEGPDDFASMEEVVFRRYKRLLDEEQSLPQLIIIDGGKGQLSSAVKSLTELGILEKVTVIGIAKKLEEIYFPGDPIPLYINKKSESLKLIQQLRNEAHRFAINFHRDRRSKAFLGTELTEIPGIGDKTAEKLLSEFGSVKKIKQTPLESIEALIGKSNAQKIVKYFKEKQD